MAGIFHNRFIRVVLLSGIFLQMGIWVRNFAILLYVMEQTQNDPHAVSMISLAEFAPIFVFSIIGGAYADRWRPKLTMIWCDVLSALSVFVVLLAIMFGTWKAVFFVTFVSAVLSQFSQPSAMKLFKVHIPQEQLQTGMAMYQTLMAIFMIIGPMLGTFVYHNFGIYVSVGVMGVMFLMSAGVLVFIPSAPMEREKPLPTHIWLEMKDGMYFVWNSKILTVLGGVFFVAGLAVGVLQPLGVFIVIERLGLPKENLQWLLAANGAAMLIGGGLVAGAAKKISPQKLVAGGLLANAISVAGIGLSTDWILTLSFQFLNGLFMPCIHIGINTLILQFTKEEYVGRVNGVLNPLFMGAMVGTMSFAGWLKAHFSLVAIYGAASIVLLTGMFLMIPLFNIGVPKGATNLND